jgi:hypothetical protein
MVKQIRLDFPEEEDFEKLEELWETLPEQARQEVTQHYARLMARASVQRIRALKADREVSDEPND